jgi:hypothetical protein
MSAKLMKILATGVCRVQNARSGQVRVYWDQGGVRRYLDIDAHTTVDLHLQAPIECLRKSASLRALVHEGHLLILA